MTRKRQIMPPKILTPLLCLGFVLAWVGSAEAQGDRTLPSVSDDGYVLPQYPEILAMAWLNGDFELDLKLNQGNVVDIKVTGCRLFVTDLIDKLKSVQRPSKDLKCPDQKPDSFSTLMLQSIERALKQWTFSKWTDDVFHMTVRFRSIYSDVERSFMYHLDRKGSIPYPNVITIEFHHSIRTIHG